MSSIKEFSHTNKKNHTNSSSSKRTPSFSSTSSSSSSSNSSFSFISQEFSIPNTPSTSFHHNSSSKGIPFSWETIPGIPKTQQMILKKVDSSRKPKIMTNLPLPPPISTTKKHYISRKDPFYVALVECSKGGDAGFEDNNVKSLSTRFGLVNMSCNKNNSTSVSESLVFLPRSGPRRVSYDLLKKRSG